jgi:hypothetical protein
MDSFWMELSDVAVNDRRARLFRLKNEAPRFSALAFFKSGEVVATEILADLLTPTAPHGQGYSFLEKFLHALGSPPPGKPNHVVIETNAPCYTFRSAGCITSADPQPRRKMMDIVIEYRVANPDMDYVVVIESKSHGADDQDWQIRDYLQYIEKVYPRHHKSLFYLNDGQPPSEASIPKHEWDAAVSHDVCHAKSYLDVMQTWVKSCMDICAAPKVRAFLRDFAEFIKVETMMTDGVESQTSNRIDEIISSSSTDSASNNEAFLEALLAIYALHDHIWEKAVTVCMNRISELLQARLPGWESPAVLPDFGSEDPYISMHLRKASWRDNLFIYLGTQDDECHRHCHFDLALKKQGSMQGTDGRFYENLPILGPRSKDPTREIRLPGVDNLRSAEGIRSLLTDQAADDIAREIMTFINDHEITMDRMSYGLEGDHG